MPRHLIKCLICLYAYDIYKMCSNLPTHIDILATYTKKNELYKYLILLTNQLITIALLYCTKNNCLHNLNLTRIFILNSRRLTNTFSGPYYIILNTL